MRVKSIRVQLVVYLVIGSVLVEIGAGAGLYGYVEETLERALDTALAAKAEQIAAAVHIEDDGQPHLLISEAAGVTLPHREGTFFFQIWRADGTTLARAGPHGDDRPLPRISKTRKRFGDVTVGNGISSRAIQISIVPHPDEDEFDLPNKNLPAPKEVMTLVVAHDRGAIDEPLTIVLSGLCFMFLVMTGGIIGIVSWSVRRGLGPLNAVARQVDEISSTSLDVRFAVESLPLEILPIGQKLNDLMERLQAAFERERRFSGDVAHELRTPIAELRSLCEVSLRWPDENRPTDAVREALAIGIQMESVVNALLALVRCQAGVDVPQLQTLDLKAMVDALWKPMKPVADAKELTVTLSAEGDVRVEMDLNMLSVVIRNLLVNAIQYVPAGGDVTIEILGGAAEVKVRIANTNTSLNEDDLSHLFEPFWRKDLARTESNHQGLGLAIVQEYCRALGVPIEMGLDKQRWFWVSVTIPRRESREKAGVLSGTG